MTELKPTKEQKPEKKHRRRITIYGLLSYYGTERAKKCAMYLYRTLPCLYKKPTINTYYDYEWVEVVKKLQEEYGSKYRRIKYLKNPVIVFFNDQYVGDHRAIIHYVIMEHKILPDLPFPNLFPDFTDLLPKNGYKDYVYFDIRVGDLDDYVIGKMVFELHSDVVPETSRFFANLCMPFHERVYGTNEPRWKHSYLGSTIHRICGNSFVQGGKITGCGLRVKDENYAVKHIRRGVISICNEGGNNSTTEFCISLKENQWLDGEVIAFGQLIFGEPILTAIQEVPTYYQRPLKEIIIVGCGVIPAYEDEIDYNFRTKIEKQKEEINLDIETLRKKRIEDVKNFEEKVKSFLNLSEVERNVEYMYLEDIEPTDMLGEYIQEKMTVSEEAGEEEKDAGEEEQEDEAEEEEDFLKKKFLEGDFTLKELMEKHREKHTVGLSDIMSKIVDEIVEGMDYAVSGDETEPLDYIPKKVITDAADVREVPSDQFLEERFDAGLYSIPESMRKLLVKTFEHLTPSQLKMIGIKSRDILRKAGVSESTLRLVSSENIMSGLMIAVADASTFREQGGLGLSGSIDDILSEVCQDTVEVIQQRGTQLIRGMLGNCSKDPLSVGEESVEEIIEERKEGSAIENIKEITEDSIEGN